mgnify:CR=1 FL=1
MIPAYIIEPNYREGLESATWQLIRTKDDAILRSLKLTRDNLAYLLGYCYALDYNVVIC